MHQYASIDLRDCVQLGEHQLAEAHGGSAPGGGPGDPWPGYPADCSSPSRQPPAPATDWLPSPYESASTRYPSGVEMCSTPRQYYHVLRRSGGEICAHLPGCPSSVLRYEDGEWYCYERRAGRPPHVERLDRASALERLRGDRPILIADREVPDLLAAGARRRRESPAPDSRGPPGGQKAASGSGPVGGRR